MDLVNYLIYPIAAFLAFLAIGGLATRHPTVVVASLISLVLNAYAMIGYTWWPIVASLVVDWSVKKLFGDPGSREVTSEADQDRPSGRDVQD